MSGVPPKVSAGDTSRVGPSISDAEYQSKVRLTQIDEATMADCKTMSSKKAHALAATHPLWPVAEIGFIACGKVSIGMDATQVRAAWGAPEEINRTTTANGENKQWVSNGSYVYLEGGLVTAIQD